MVKLWTRLHNPAVSPTLLGITWVCAAAAVVGPFLSWSYSTSAAEAVYQWLSSAVTRPNLEWWIWFLAPLSAGIIAAKGLIQEGRIARLVLLPCAVFLVAWLLIFVVGDYRYTGFDEIGFTTSFVGVVGLALITIVDLLQGR